MEERSNRICESGSLLATNLPLLPRRLQLPVTLCVDLLLPPRQEWSRGSIPVSDLWGLPSVRSVQVFNNCLIHATQAHRPLLERWLQMTRDPRYREAPALPFERRPIQVAHDGWLLIALLESEEFGQVPCLDVG